jgi:integrase
VTSLREAQEAYRLLQVNRNAGENPQARRTPVFETYYKETYLPWVKKMTKKSVLTQNKEKYALDGWAKTIGGLTLTLITPVEIDKHLMARKDAGASNRTINLDVIALNNCLKKAKKDGWLKRLPTADLDPLDHRAPKKKLRPSEDLDTICNEALRRDDDGLLAYANGQQLSDYVRFMSFTGARRESASHVSWGDVDFENRRVRLVKTKYDKANLIVPFNEQLEKLLLEMKGRRLKEEGKKGAPENGWLFPNPHDLSARANFRKTLDKVRKATGLLDFNYHDCRHWFISHAVMDGIDYLTIATIVGHEDGGILIGKCYGHLNDEHLQAKAAQMTFGRKGDLKENTVQITQRNELADKTDEELLAELMRRQMTKQIAA